MASGKSRVFSGMGTTGTYGWKFPQAGLRYVVEKGSIAIDGISLTVAALRASVLEIAIIPHTFENTNLKHARSGDAVNLEFDVIAKYVERMLNRSES